MRTVTLKNSDGSWEALKEEWSGECATLGEDFEGYAYATFAALDPLADEEPGDARICALNTDNHHAAIFQANVTGLPGYQGPVLRVRLLTVSPKYDFGDFDLMEYAQLLGGVFAGIVVLSQGEMRANHIKIHLRSPADMQFFAALEGTLGQMAEFTSVKLKGAWLYITLKAPGARAGGVK